MGALTPWGLSGQGTAGADISGASRSSKVLMAKLDQILANDEAILTKFDAIMQELQVVKIRALRRPTPLPP